MSEFRFKQFTIQHDNSTMKVGTDAVLIGAWTDVSKARSILDVGTGSGVIALMVAQRTMADTTIDAIEPDANSVKEASVNIAQSPWSSRVAVHQTTIQDFQPAGQYDLIISNPPYFQRSFRPPKASRVVARHTETLSFDDLLLASSRLLKPDGRLALILPATEGSEFRHLALRYGYKCHRSTAFYSREGKPQERWLMEFSKNGIETEPGRFVLHGDGEAWSGEYRELTGEFYL
jgi:tRNA1Val (adenine37-N6)-methyltransferase